MTEDERNEKEQTTEEGQEVEAHGVKEVAGVGLAAAALLGAGATAAELTGDSSPRQRVEGALIAPDDLTARLQKADADRDGYVNYRELADVNLKWVTDKLQAEGLDVSAEGLAAAGNKIDIEQVGKEEGFAVEGDTIMLKRGVEPGLDELAAGPASEWSYKFKEIDRDQDGYASYEELALSDWYKWNTDELRAAGYDVSAEELAKLGYKQPLETFGEGGFVTKEGMVMLRFGVDSKLDAAIKGETRE